MTATLRRPLTRAAKLLAVVITAVALALTGCARTSSSPPTEPAAGAGWSFTDDLGRVVTLGARPSRVAALNDVVFSLVNYGLKPVASFGWKTVSTDQRFTGLDVSDVVDLGASYGEIDVEKLAATAPELVVTYVYPEDSSGKLDPGKPLYGFKDLAQQKQVEAIAPVVAIAMKGSAADVIQRVTDLAVSLGAQDAVVAAGRTAYDAASKQLSTAAAGGLVTQVLYAEASQVYLAKAPDDPSLKLYQSLGMTFTVGQTKDYYWDILSWEKYDSVGGDLVLYSLLGLDKAALLKQPTFAASPAAEADQVHPWVLAGMDYVSQAAYMEQLAGWLSASKKVD